MKILNPRPMKHGDFIEDTFLKLMITSQSGLLIIQNHGYISTAPASP
jgi:hypothetical protein